MDARILLLAFLAGGSEAALIVIAPQLFESDMVLGLAAGYCLALAGTLAAAMLGLPPRAWVGRIALGATVGLLAHGLASALAASWAASPQGSPVWLCLAAPLIGAVGGLLGSLVEGAFPDRPAREPGGRTRRRA